MEGARAALARGVRRYRADLVFRGQVGIWASMLVNFANAIFRVASALRFPSAWLVSLAVYYLVLGVLRAHLVCPVRQAGFLEELACYRVVACCLFLLNVSMGGMIVLMVRTNSGFSYPGYLIYLSALYTFYSHGARRTLYAGEKPKARERGQRR